MRIALVHDWLTGMRGGERCLEAFLRLFPSADVITMIHKEGSTNALIDKAVTQASFLSKLPGIGKYYQACLPIFPYAARSLRLEGYDLVISLSHAAVKNVVVPPGTFHLCYCFTPMRYIWDQAPQYLGTKRYLAWPIIKALRHWDVKGSASVNRFIAISKFIAARIRLYYGRESDVVYPPVESSWIQPAKEGTQGEAFLYAGALVPYKRPDAVVRAFRNLPYKLWIVGKGPLEKKLRQIASSNVEFIPKASDSELAERYARCRALVFPSVEDFGIIPVECMAAGRPVIGIGAGALLESIQSVKTWVPQSYERGVLEKNGSTGILFRPGAPDLVEEIQKAVTNFISLEERFSVAACVAQARKFSPAVFAQNLTQILTEIDGFSDSALSIGGKCAQGETAAL